MTPPPAARTEPESPAPVRDLGDLQIAVLRVLWKRGRATVHETLSEFPATRKPAYTTVLTVLRNLEKRGLVTHDAPNGSRTFTYLPALSRREAYGGLLQDMLDRLFDGSPAALIVHVLETADISADEWDAILEAIRARGALFSSVSSSS